jgi:hypothetical protein
MEAFEEYQEAVIGGNAEIETDHTGSGLPKDKVLDFIKGLQNELEGRTGEPFQQALFRLKELSTEISARAELDLREVDSGLAEISSKLTDALRRELKDETWKAILRDSRKAVKIYRKHVAPAMFEKLKQKQIERSLREYFDLPEFSLLHCE